MKALPVKARIYIVVLLSTTVLLTVPYLVMATLTPTLLLHIVLFALATAIADFYPIALPQEGNSEVTISGALKTAVAIAFGPIETIIITLLGTLLAELMLRRTWYKAAFNIAQMTLTYASMSVIYQLLYDGIRAPFHSVQNAGAVILMLLAYYLFNTGMATTIVSLATGASFWHIWKVNFRDSLWNNLTIIPVGAVTAALWFYSPWSVLALVLPLVVVRQSFQFIADLRDQTRAALISMADAIDQRDPSTYQHSQRVALIAEAIAEQMELPPEDIEMIRMTARLHDLGKIGMSNALLYKPGKFDENEREQFSHHPAIGAELIKSFRLFREGQSIILYHHERYDGKGYPTGLAGEAIPLGSRILAVADSLDAMTSRRVYQRSRALSDAMQELVKCKGTQFDAQVVDAFLKAVDQWKGRLPWAEEEPVPLPEQPVPPNPKPPSERLVISAISAAGQVPK